MEGGGRAGEVERRGRVLARAGELLLALQLQLCPLLLRLPQPLCLRPSASALLPQPLCLSPSDAVIVCTTCERAADLEKGAPTDLDKSHACPSFHPLPPLPLGPALL